MLTSSSRADIPLEKVRPLWAFATMQYWMTYLLLLLAILLIYPQWRLLRYRAQLKHREELFRIVAETPPT